MFIVALIAALLFGQSAFAPVTLVRESIEMVGVLAPAARRAGFLVAMPVFETIDAAQMSGNLPVLFRLFRNMATNRNGCCAPRLCAV